MREVMRTSFERGMFAKMLQGKFQFYFLKGFPDALSGH